GERGGGRGTAPKVLGALVAQPAEVDDPLDALLPRHLCEVLGGPLLAVGEPLAAAAAAHRMDEVVRGLDALPGAAQAVRVEHVALVQRVPGAGERRRAAAVANEAAHVGAALREGGGEPAADEAGGAGDEGAHGAVGTTGDSGATSGPGERRHRRGTSVAY